MLRDYQLKLAQKGYELIKKYHILYYVMEMRVGKTLTSFQVAKLLNAKKVLFVTTNRAKPFTEEDYQNNFKDDFDIDIVNYESIHKYQTKQYDLVICDEAQKMGHFPQPAKRAKPIRKILFGSKQTRLILLSGTPTPESYSQLYHQLWIHPNNPFKQWANFYEWVRAGFVQVTKKRVGAGREINDYSHADKDRIKLLTNHLFISYTQKEAGFTVNHLDDTIVEVPIDNRIQQLVQILLKDRYYMFKDNQHEIVCETAVKLQKKVHQIYSGSVITELLPNQDKGDVMFLDYSKANYILENYRNQKIAIFYLYTGEGDMLKHTLPNVTDDPMIFRKDPNSIFIGQFQAFARGVNLAVVDVIIFYNIHFSSELYQQARQRGQEKNKQKATKLVWLFSKNGIEQNIYKRVINKLPYTNSYFRRDYGVKGA